MKPLSFRLRIALLSALLSGIVLVGFGVSSWYLIRRQKLESLDTEIRSLGARHPGWFAGRGNPERLNSALEFTFGSEHHDQVILLIKDSAGRTLFTSAGWPKDLDPDGLDCSLADDPRASQAGGDSGGSAGVADGQGFGRSHPEWGRGGGRGGGPPQVAFTKLPRFRTVRSGNTSWRLGKLGTAETTLVIGLSLAAVEAEVGRVRNLYLAVLPAAFLAIGWGGWLVAGRAVRPLRVITETAERVTAKGLDQRVPRSDADPEIARLTRVLNGMMDRLEASFHQATRFSADASHELKTPLAVMQGELESALQAAAPGSGEQRVFAGLLEEVQRLKNIIRSLLLLAQADAGRLPLTAERTDLTALLREVCEDFEAMTVDARIGVELAAPGEIWLAADTSLLRQAVMNLLQNAVRYNEPGGWIRVAATVCGDRVDVEVCNGGAGIAPADQPRIFDRFFRADTARDRSAEGMGLGLSLAREIVRAHRGDLILKESRPGRTCFRFSLPRETAV